MSEDWSKTVIGRPVLHPSLRDTREESGHVTGTVAELRDSGWGLGRGQRDPCPRRSPRGAGSGVTVRVDSIRDWSRSVSLGLDFGHNLCELFECIVKQHPLNLGGLLYNFGIGTMDTYTRINLYPRTVHSTFTSMNSTPV